MAIEAQIWHGIKNSEVTSLDELYRMYHQVLFNYGRKMTKDQQLIEDAVQETFISIWKYRQTLSAPAAVKQYLLKTFRNQLLKVFKERLGTTYIDEQVNFSFEISFDHKIIEGEDAEKLSVEINNAIAQLSSRQREIIYYRFYENLSFDEIAGIMNMQTRATYKLTARALSALKEIMQPGTFLKFLFMMLH